MAALDGQSEKTYSTTMQTVGTPLTETVYEMEFNEKNLKELFEKRENDSDISLSLKDEVSDKEVEVKTLDLG